MEEEELENPPRVLEPIAGLNAETQSALAAALSGVPMQGMSAIAFNNSQHAQMSRSVHVGNLSPLVTDEVLRNIFGCIGPIQELRVGKGAKYAFIDFLDSSSAETALGLNGTDIGGQAIKVERAATPKLTQTAKPAAPPAVIPGIGLPGLGLPGMFPLPGMGGLPSMGGIQTLGFPGMGGMPGMGAMGGFPGMGGIPGMSAGGGMGGLSSLGGPSNSQLAQMQQLLASLPNAKLNAHHPLMSLPFGGGAPGTDEMTGKEEGAAEQEDGEGKKKSKKSKKSKKKSRGDDRSGSDEDDEGDRKHRKRRSRSRSRSRSYSPRRRRSRSPPRRRRSPSPRRRRSPSPRGYRRYDDRDRYGSDRYRPRYSRRSPTPPPRRGRGRSRSRDRSRSRGRGSRSRDRNRRRSRSRDKKVNVKEGEGAVAHEALGEEKNKGIAGSVDAATIAERTDDVPVVSDERLASTSEPEEMQANEETPAARSPGGGDVPPASSIE